MMTQVLEDYCLEQKIAKSGLLREAIAERIFMLFESGVKSPEAIMAALVGVSPNTS
jgi:hypothetical protein